MQRAQRHTGVRGDQGLLTGKCLLPGGGDTEAIEESDGLGCRRGGEARLRGERESVGGRPGWEGGAARMEARAGMGGEKGSLLSAQSTGWDWLPGRGSSKTP